LAEISDSGIAAILNDIRSYARVGAAASSRQTAARVFDSYEKALVYTKMDGKTSTYKIAEATGVPQRTVATWADDFVQANLAAPPDEFHSSHKALFSLSELAIDISALRKRKKQADAAQQQASPTLDTETGKAAQEAAPSG
jgi:hypothetical protein